MITDDIVHSITEIVLDDDFCDLSTSTIDSAEVERERVKYPILASLGCLTIHITNFQTEYDLVA